MNVHAAIAVAEKQAPCRALLGKGVRDLIGGRARDTSEASQDFGLECSEKKGKKETKQPN